MTTDRNDSRKYESLWSLGSVMEFLDPSSVNSPYLNSTPKRNSYLEKARLKLKKLDVVASKSVPSKQKIYEDIKSKLSQRVKDVDNSLDTIFFKNSTSLEKAFYPFTLLNLFLIGYIMGKFPDWFHVYYTGLLGLFMPIRFYTYYKANNHYFLADLCYFVNLLCLLYIWVWPNSTSLYHSCFALTFGSLSFAVITWRNSLIIHSIDKITSCFIHLMPPCTMFIIQHSLTSEFRKQRFPAAYYSASMPYQIKYNIYWTSFYYLIWQSSYHYFITVREAKKIKTGQRMTSFQYLTTHNFKDLWIMKLPSPLPLIIFTFAQYLYQLTTMSLCYIWFPHKKAASLFLIFIFLCAAHNGATYYIDYYGKKFNKEMDKLRLEVDNLQQQLSIRDLDSPNISRSVSPSLISSISSVVSDDTRSSAV
ncbi:hypothetical protein TBLA_0C04210 [Henningerozyma blattae CBS 6284]|uniref:Glycerophosphocholine acyltransferase 1 n=1 Tax=Henningerozyma blattae (strain ATCC 34711 / CBS 6284 / DSM 70876 / NBRC 10599 / NRRL Y-10934 / UCD 77-7) TaxID=1071380 RepID=I2H1G9_HENB6|nr:hypothetical protein TBLA_0C04210 [Tetrapisispora blattae CBS 6284]CCH60221.1 hypothetical protein TBLA_0C04210 [Tetrapisispora blattae CBS 6284]